MVMPSLNPRRRRSLQSCVVRQTQGCVPVRMMDGGHHPAPRESCASCDVSADRNFIVITYSTSFLILGFLKLNVEPHLMRDVDETEICNDRNISPVKFAFCHRVHAEMNAMLD
jgi:hypothetical protein